MQTNLTGPEVCFMADAFALGRMGEKVAHEAWTEILEARGMKVRECIGYGQLFLRRAEATRRALGNLLVLDDTEATTTVGDLLAANPDLEAPEVAAVLALDPGASLVLGGGAGATMVVTRVL